MNKIEMLRQEIENKRVRMSILAKEMDALQDEYDGLQEEIWDIEECIQNECLN